MSRPQFRMPTTESGKAFWEARKKVLLPLIEQGYTSEEIAELLPITASQVRSNYQRLYNELDLPKGQRNSVTLIRAIYAAGWLPCPCGGEHGTTEENGTLDSVALG